MPVTAIYTAAENTPPPVGSVIEIVWLPTRLPNAKQPHADLCVGHRYRVIEPKTDAQSVQKRAERGPGVFLVKNVASTSQDNAAYVWANMQYSVVSYPGDPPARGTTFTNTTYIHVASQKEQDMANYQFNNDAVETIDGWVGQIKLGPTIIWQSAPVTEADRPDKDGTWSPAGEALHRAEVALTKGLTGVLKKQG